MARDLIDRPALLRHRARAERAPESFLHQIAHEEISERLKEVNRSFKSVAIVTGQPKFWQEKWPEARVLPDTEVLGLEAGTHDLVIHALALHWANDPLGQIIQCRRALRPDGLFLSVQFGGRALHELRSALAEAEIALSGGLSPRVLPTGELRDLGALLLRADLALPVADSTLVSLSYASLPDLMRDLRQMGETNALTDRRKTASSRALFAKAAEIYAAHFSDAQQRLMATVEMVYLTGWAPDPSQQQPLRPGSAAARLADALNTTEFDAGEATVYPAQDNKADAPDDN